jgi:NAD-dependent deacetylase
LQKNKETMKHIVVFTGAGISAESGLGTFRDADGLWEKYRIEDVCTHEAWERNPQLCVDFYNARRRDALAAQPNAAHEAIARLQEACPGTQVITQNIDDLHERAGCHDVVHLHGEITKLRSSINETATVPLKGWEQHYGERHPDGSLLRPYIVFFGEGVPYFTDACRIAGEADVLVVVGTSLNVYPAASLLQYAPAHAPIYFVDPGMPEFGMFSTRVQHIRQKATEGVPPLVERLIREYR